MRVMFKRCSPEHSPLCFTEHRAKFQVPVPASRYQPSDFCSGHALAVSNAREATA